MREERVLLEHQPGGPALRREMVMAIVDERPGEVDRARVDRHQPGDRPQQRRLAAAARTDQSEQFTGCEFEVDTVDCEDVLVGLDDGIEPKRRDGHARSVPRDS